MMEVGLLILFVILNMVLAYFDANKIKQNTRIYHGINGLVYMALLTLAYLLTSNWLLIAGLTILRIPVFNTALNYFRDKELTHISKHTTSIIDQFTNKIPEKVGYWTYHSILLLISLILILL
jgi:uncharacterized membrane protein